MNHKKKVTLIVIIVGLICLAFPAIAAMNTRGARSAISFSSDSITMRLGESLSLPDQLIGQSELKLKEDIVFESSNSAVAEIRANTLIARCDGQATVTALYKGGKCSSIEVTVRAIPVSAFSFEAEEATLLIGREMVPAILYEPPDATDALFTLASSNPDIATVSGGKITGIASGEAQISATHGEESVSFTLHVQPVAAQSLTLEASPLYPDETQEIEAIFEPADTTDKTLSWTSSNPKVLQIENGVVTAIAPGSALVSARHASGIQAQVKVEVLDVFPSKVELSSSSYSAYENGSLLLEASFAPENVTVTTLSWTSSNEKVATVSGGKVKCISQGEATITATSPNGVSGIYEIEVKGNSRTMNVSVYQYCEDRNHVGNEWSYTHKVDSKTLAGYKDQVTIKRGGKITLYSKVVEEDSVPDVGTNSKTYVVKDDDFENGFSVEFTVTVRENRGRYSGNKAVWTITYEFNPAD